MESVKVKGQKDDKITNKDDSVTNKDGNKGQKEGKQSADQNKTAKEPVLTMISDNDNAGELADESASNKGQGPSGENL